MPMTPSISVRIPIEVKVEAVDIASKKVRVSILQSQGAIKRTIVTPGESVHFVVEVER